MLVSLPRMWHGYVDETACWSDGDCVLEASAVLLSVASLVTVGTTALAAVDG